MPHIDHEQACKILLRILPNMDTKQVEEVLSLTNKSLIGTQRFIDLIWISELLWSSRKDNFEFIIQEHSQSSDLGLLSVLPDVHGMDYEEEHFANRMKKKKKGRKLY